LSRGPALRAWCSAELPNAFEHPKCPGHHHDSNAMRDVQVESNAVRETLCERHAVKETLSRMQVKKVTQCKKVSVKKPRGKSRNVEESRRELRSVVEALTASSTPHCGRSEGLERSAARITGAFGAYANKWPSLFWNEAFEPLRPSIHFSLLPGILTEAVSSLPPLDFADRYLHQADAQRQFGG